MRLAFSPRAWRDYQWFQDNDRKLLKKLNRLLEECTRTPYEGTGLPEALKHELSGLWSRRINDEHRLVYALETTEEDETLYIASCRFHYES